MDREVIRVGRQTDNHIQFFESHVSKKHAEILRRGDQFLIVDLGSKSGVYVNGRRVQEQALEEKDVITLGTSQIPSLRFSRSVFEPDPLSHSKLLLALKDSTEGQGLEKLARFLGFHRLMGQRINLNEILENVVDLSAEQIDAERGFLILRGPEDSLEYRVARERNKRSIPPPEILVSETIVRDTLDRGKIRVVLDVWDEKSLIGKESILSLDLRSAVALPLWRFSVAESENSPVQLSDEVFGVLYLDSKMNRQTFTHLDRGILEALARNASSVIENARLFREAEEKRRIRRAFSFYLSQEMIEKIVADPASLKLGGEEIIGTALFTDVQGFTTIAESLGAPETATLLNNYFTQVNCHIFAERGTLLKFIGDSVFAIWGAPVRIENHATPACAAALAVAKAQDPGSGGEPSVLTKLVTRIGVNTGFMLVGNLGSEERFDYTAVGDAVNIAARLEGLNKFFGTKVIASGATVDLTKGKFVVRRLGRVRLAGKNKPVEIFEILGQQGEATVPDAPALARFEQALGDFSARRFGEAADGFRQVLAMCGGKDGPSDFYLGRIERFRLEPPPEDWDGTVTLESK